MELLTIGWPEKKRKNALSGAFLTFIKQIQNYFV